MVAAGRRAPARRVVSYAALCFAEDANLASRTYWYRCAFPVREGERVLAPVGAHDRLQRAEVVRVLPASCPPPYDERLLKEVAARCGAYRRNADGETLFETGGIPYDEKHYTRYGRVLFGGNGRYYRGMTPVPAERAADALRALPREGCVLLAGGAAAEAAAALLLLAGASERDVCARLALCGSPQDAGRLSVVLNGFSAEERAALAAILR